MLRQISFNDRDEWDDIVKSFDNYDVYYLNEYVDAFRIHGDGEPILFYFEDNCTRAFNVAMLRDISLFWAFKNVIRPKTFYDLVTPYGYGGWIVEGRENNKLLIREYEEWCRNNSIISEFIRFNPVLRNHLFVDSFYEIVPLGETVAIDITNKDGIWNNFSSKNRNVIRKALNNGIQIKNGLSKAILKSFIEIYNRTMEKDNAEEYYYFEDAFYASILNKLKDNATVFYAELDNKIIAASLMIFANKKLNYHLSGSVKEFQHLAPTNLLLFKTAEWGFDRGFQTFHLGGGLGSSEDGLFRFKRAFYKKELCRFYVGKKVYNQVVYDELVKIRGCSIEKPSFFPEYRG